MGVQNSGIIVQAMSLVEDYTPIKPYLGKGNTFDDAMFYVGLFGLRQEHVFLLVAIGLAYAITVA